MFSYQSADSPWRTFLSLGRKSSAGIINHRDRPRKVSPNRSWKVYWKKRNRMKTVVLEALTIGLVNCWKKKWIGGKGEGIGGQKMFFRENTNFKTYISKIFMLSVGHKIDLNKRKFGPIASVVCQRRIFLYKI